MKILVTVNSEHRNDGAADLLLSVDHGTVTDIVRDVADVLLPGRDPAPLRLWRAGTELPGQAEAAAVLRDGDRLQLGQTPGSAVGARSHQAKVVVISGPDAGLVAELAQGTHSVGREGAVRLADPQASRHHADITVDETGVHIADADSTHGTLVDLTEATGRVPVSVGQLIGIGRNLLVVAPAGEPTPRLPVDQVTGGLLFHRARRMLQTTPPPLVLDVPTAPQEPERRRIPVVAVLVPLLIGGVMAFLLRQPAYLLFTLMSPLMLISNLMSDRMSGRHAQRAQARRYRDDLQNVRHALESSMAQQRLRLRDESPDPAVVVATAAGAGRRLWERRPADADFLRLRLGTGSVSSLTSVRADGVTTVQLLPDSPICADLPAVGVLAVTGPVGHARLTMRWLVAQVACWHSPSDVRLVVITGDDHPSTHAWQWAKFLPHLRDEDVFAIGATKVAASARLAELATIIRTRQQAHSDYNRPAIFPPVVVVIDDTHALRRTPGLLETLREGPAVSVWTICRDDSDSQAPQEAHGLLALDTTAPWTGLLHIEGEPTREVSGVDGISAVQGEQLARALAPLRDDGGSTDQASALPSSVRLVDLVCGGAPDPDRINFSWETAATTAVIVGVDSTGPITLDLVHDGPHALVAGTTGSGKSEFLQTWVVSLAVANPPDAVSFVLVDYKGAATFATIAKLPHVAGMVSDLDETLAARALASLGAEVRRRERLLHQAGTPHIDAYVGAGKPLGPMPRLVLIVDEFRALAQDLPAFLPGLVDIAQRGRSLGVHLVLATQKPGGIVSADIRANMTLRVALRVADPGDSLEILGVDDAAQLPARPKGRAFVRTGPDSLAAFQVAHVSAPVRQLVGRIGTAHVVTWASLGRAVETSSALAGSAETTDLDELVDAIVTAARLSGQARAASPWVDPLPVSVPATGVSPLLGIHAPGSAPYALVDLPSQQRNDVASFDVGRGQHLLFAGTAGSGRSTALRTVAAGLATSSTVDDVHLYGIDCGSGSLLALARLPHCGAIVSAGETDRLERLLSFLAAELARRRTVLGAGGWANLAEQRASVPPDSALPYIVVLLDRWESWMAQLDSIDSGRLTVAFLDLVAEGSGAGLLMVISGDRQLLFGKLASLVGEKVLLRLADRSDGRLVGVNRDLPAAMPPGRAVRAADGADLQLVYVGTSPDGAAQADSISRLADDLLPAAAAARSSPVRIEVLPKVVTRADAERLPREPMVEGAGWLPVGVGGTQLEVCGIDLDVDGPGFVVAGPSKSGRSTALRFMAEGGLARGFEVVAFAPRQSPLRDLAGRPGVLGVLTGTEPDPMAAVELLKAAKGRLLVVVDDAEQLMSAKVSELFVQVVREGVDEGHALLLGGQVADFSQALRGFVRDGLRSRSGLLLCPPAHHFGELFGARLARSAAFSSPVGRGWLFRAGTPVLVQVPCGDSALTR